MAERLPFYNLDACMVLKNVLDTNSLIIEKRYRDDMKHGCILKGYEMNANEEDDKHTSILLKLEYIKNVNKIGKISPVDVVLNLKILCGLGDRAWGYRSKIKVWDGDYPSTVGVDVKSGKVYLLFVRQDVLEVVEFGQIEEKELDMFLDSLNDREPYKIGLEEDTLFDYLDGNEGYNYLKNHVYIQFNCCSKLKVYSRLK